MKDNYLIKDVERVAFERISYNSTHRISKTLGTNIGSEVKDGVDFFVMTLWASMWGYSLKKY